MMRYFAELSYKGSNYNGWQRQNNAPSVQQTLEEALSTLLRSDISITGAGRTDTGVHASYFVAHFDLEQSIENSTDLVYHLNSFLPPDIAISHITAVNIDAHARFDAVQREYKYYMLDYKNPFCRDTTWQYYAYLDIDEMNLAATHLLNADDFTTFSKLHSNNKTNICDITHAQWAMEGDQLVFTIRANRFLRNMVRSITSTLVDVGRRKISHERFAEILVAKERSFASGSAPAHGLFLTDIRYSDNIFRRTR